MLEQANGSKLHQIVLTFDPETQTVRIDFAPTQFKTWEMVTAVLGIAHDDAKFRLNAIRAQIMQAQQIQAMQEQQIKGRIMRG